MFDAYLSALEKRVDALEKEIAELKVQVSVRPAFSIDEIMEGIVKRLENSSFSHSL